jgi:hypothetical protein
MIRSLSNRSRSPRHRCLCGPAFYLLRAVTTKGRFRHQLYRCASVVARGVHGQWGMKKSINESPSRPGYCSRRRLKYRKGDARPAPRSCEDMASIPPIRRTLKLAKVKTGNWLGQTDGFADYLTRDVCKKIRRAGICRLAAFLVELFL